MERLAEGPRPDLVISDYMMPVLDRSGLLHAMRDTEAQRDCMDWGVGVIGAR